MVSVCAIETPDEELPLWTSCNTVRFSIFRSVAGRSGLGPVKLVCEAVCARGSEDHTPSIAFRHLPPKEGCRKPVLGVLGVGVWVYVCECVRALVGGCIILRRVCVCAHT